MPVFKREADPDFVRPREDNEDPITPIITKANEHPSIIATPLQSWF